MPYYELDRSTGREGGRRKNYDECPQVDSICTKNFPTVSFGGYGYMFLFFCPIHGHCYGFHLLSGGEGRKDPFSVMYKYMKTPQKNCSLILLVASLNIV